MERVKAIKLVTSPSFRGSRVIEAARIQYDDPRLYEYSESRVIDLHLMIGPEYFIGSVMSQTARVAVSVGYAQETIKEAIAMDHPVSWRQNSLKLSHKDIPVWRRPLLCC